VEDPGAALRLARLFVGKIRILKVGSRLFTSCGPSLLAGLMRYVPEIFLDLKFHDIPKTVAGSVRAAAGLAGVKMLTIHASGGVPMMLAAGEAVGKRRNRPKLLAVTVLTSMDASQLQQVGIRRSPLEQVVYLARLARDAGMDGVITSPLEVTAVRKACGPNFLVVVPGIRPAAAPSPGNTSHRMLQSTWHRTPGSGPSLASDDQSRVATPAAALRAGADYLVIGRPILDAPDPMSAADAILSEMAAAIRLPRSRK
jgi:orotidine-5'-phosphate decarboxylase